MKNGRLIQKIPFQSDLPGEILPTQTVTELIGRSRVLVENHKGVCVYNSEKIILKVSFGRLCVSGTDLMLACMSRHQLVITGNIFAITVINGD